MKKLFPKIEQSNKYQQIVKYTLFLVFAVAFCAVFYFSSLKYAVVAYADKTLQSGIEMSDDIVVIGISDNDLNAFGGTPDDLVYRIVKTINSNSECKPAAICVDIMVDGLSDDTVALFKELNEKDNVIFNQNLYVSNNSLLDDMGLFETDCEIHEGTTLPKELSDSFHIGHSLKVVDSTGIYRHAIFDIVSNTGKTYSSNAWLAYTMYCDYHDLQVSVPKMSEQNTALIKFSDVESYEDRISVSSILYGNEEIDFTGKIVYVGYRVSSLSGSWLCAYDYNSTVYNLDIDASICNNFVKKQFVQTVPLDIQVFLLVLFVFLLGVILVNSVNFSGICICLVYLFFVVLITKLMYGIGYMGYCLPDIINVFVTGIFSSLLGLFLKNKQKNQELEKTLDCYLDYHISKDIINHSLLNEVNNSNSNSDRSVDVNNVNTAVLFADIRGFTSLSERIEADLLVTILNEYLSMMALCIGKYGGTLDKFLGDGAMAYWGASSADDKSVYHACLAALEMQRRAKRLSQKYEQSIGNCIEIGIGISFGSVVVGNIGSPSRMNYTVIGDVVNTASRLEEIVPKSCIYLTEEAYREVSQIAHCNEIALPFALKGKQNTVKAYELYSIPFKTEKDNDDIKENETNIINRRKITADIIALLFIVFSQFVFLANTVRQEGAKLFIYYPAMLVALSFIFTLLLLQMLLRYNEFSVINKKEHWCFAVSVSNVVSNLMVFFYFLFGVLVKEGVSALLSSSWPGSAIIYLVCPTISLVVFFRLNKPENFSIQDYIYAFIPLCLLHFISVIAIHFSDFRALYPDLFQMFYSVRHVSLSLFVEVLTIIGLYLVNKGEANKHLISTLNLKDNHSAFRVRRFLTVFSNDTVLTVLLILTDLLVAALNIRVTFKAYAQGGIRVYSNPSLIAIIVAVCCLISIALRIFCFFKNSSVETIPLYSVASFMKTLGCIIDFGSVLIIAVGGSGFATFFEPHWNGDFTVFLICPLIASIIWIKERNRYDFLTCLFSAVPFVIILPISRAAVMNIAAKGMYQFETQNFYNNREIVVIIICEILISVFMYYISRILVTLDHRPLTNCFVSVYSGKGSDGSIQQSFDDSYVIRQEDNAVIFNIGKGFREALATVKDCQNIIVLVNNRNLTAASEDIIELCNNRNIHVFAPFSISGLKTTVVKKNRKVKIFNQNELEYIKAQNDDNEFIIKLFGSVTLVFASCHLTDAADGYQILDDANILIYSGHESCKDICYLAIDSGVNSVIFSEQQLKTSVNEDILSDIQTNTYENILTLKDTQQYIIG